MLVCLCACFWIAQYYNLINVTFILATQVGIVVVCLFVFTSLIDKGRSTNRCQPSPHLNNTFVNLPKT